MILKKELVGENMVNKCRKIAIQKRLDSCKNLKKATCYEYSTFKHKSEISYFGI